MGQTLALTPHIASIGMLMLDAEGERWSKRVGPLWSSCLTWMCTR